MFTWGNDYATLSIGRVIYQGRGDQRMQNYQRFVNFKYLWCKDADEISKH